MTKSILAAAVAAVLVAPGSAGAAMKTSALLSKSCSADKIKELSGGAVVKIDKMQPTIFRVTIDESKMKFADLVKKMNAAGCFK